MSTIVRNILAWQAETPDEPALIQAGNEPLSITYTTLLHIIEDFGQQLQSAGIGKGSMICLALPNSPNFVVTFLSAIAIGATVAPLNLALKQTEIQFLLDDFEVDLVIGPEDLSVEGSSELAKALVSGPFASSRCYWDGKKAVLDILRSGRSDSLTDAGFDAEGDDNIALVLHTSGTTGRPKGVPLQASNLLASANNVVEAYSLKPEDRSVLIMPLFHIHGIVAGLLAPLLSGSCVVFPEKGNLNPAFWQDFVEHRATWWTATPTHQKILLSFPPPPAETKIRFVRSCSSPLSPVVLRQLEKTFHAPVLEAYAMTENAHHISTNPQKGSRKPGTVGLPCASIDLRIIDDDGGFLGVDERGEVAIRGPSVMHGYRHNPDANAKAFTHDGYFRTGDQGLLDRDGYLQLTGRIKELVNKGGEKISANEIDNVILEHESISEAVAFAIPDDMYGEDVGAAVVLREGCKLTPASLREWLRAQIANFKVPSKIWVVDSIPKTATGKVQRLTVAKTMLEKQ
ncbi:2-succinylbenzoate-CoA ligase, partial [Polychaeton citri CBS 116435]